jgi:anti-sigma factor RsiW
MMYCKDCVDLLADYIDGALTAEQKDALEEHLSYCPPCVTFVRTYKATTRVAKKALADKMPADVSARLHEFIAKQLAAKG